MAFFACSKGGGSNMPTDPGAGNGEGGTTTTPTIPTIIFGVYSTILVTLPADNGKVSRIQFVDAPAGRSYYTSNTDGTANPTILVKNANAEPRIDSTLGTIARADYPNTFTGETAAAAAADTLTKLYFVVNNGTTRYVFVPCIKSNIVGSGAVNCQSIISNFAATVTNA